MQDVALTINNSEMVFNYGSFFLWAEFLLGAWLVAGLYVRRKVTRGDLIIICIMVFMFFAPADFSWRIKLE